MKLNLENFNKLIKDEKTICKKLKISRAQLWRARKGHNVGHKFISNFKQAFPLTSLDEYFF